MQSASKGALSVPPAEMIEILVHLAVHNKIFAEKACMTLAGWDEAASRTVAADATTPKEVLEYFIAPENLRPALLPALLENPSVSQESLVRLAASGTSGIVQCMCASPRVAQSEGILRALRANPNLAAQDVAGVEGKLSGFQKLNEAGDATAGDASDAVEVPDHVVQSFLNEHATELATEANKPFELTANPLDESAPTEKVQAAAVGADGGSAPAGHEQHAAKKSSFLSAGHEKGSALQKIAKLDVKGRIQLAIKGNKEERSLLIRDGTKLVALAVLESPKVTDGEVERFATQKNVLEAVLRAIPMKRKFMKQYPVVRNLAANPRTPIDVTLGLMKHLLIQDLKNLSGNKDVSETVRKLALKMFKQKLDVTKK